MVDATEIIKKNIKSVPEWVKNARERSRTLKALIRGEGFKDELSRIEHIEKSSEKWKAREKYSRSIVDLNSRLMRPIDNVYSATGGSKNLDLPDNVRADVLKQITHIRGNISLEKWLQNYWMPVYHDDPNGVIFMAWKDKKTWPTYISINDIRAYESNGQIVDWILFEPRKAKIGDEIVDLWRFVDKDKDYTFTVKDEDISIIEDRTFPNPFGECPAIVNSDILKIGTEERLSPFSDVVEIQQEYLRDQSILTIVKFLNGFKQLVRPRIVCPNCHGMGKDGSRSCGDSCKDGFLVGGDVTDEIIIPIDFTAENQNIPSAKDLAMFIGLDTETWDQYNEEKVLMESVMFRTVWGSLFGFNESNGQKTQLEVWSNTQPVINRLNVYSDTASFMESKCAWWVAKFNYSSIQDGAVHFSNGKRFILDPPDELLRKYIEAKNDEAPVTVLDRMLSEYITAKWKTDPKQLGIELIKKELEPYIHYNIDQVQTIFGTEEAQRKMMFTDWFESVMVSVNDNAEQLAKKFDDYFQLNKKENGNSSMQEN